MTILQSFAKRDMANKYSKAKKGFNFLAPFYDFSTWLFFGNALSESQAYFLKDLGACKSVLVFGGGTGKILLELEKYQHAERICYVDISDEMISKAQKRIQLRSPSGFPSLEFISGSYTDIPPDEKFDLIITPYVLDCFDGADLAALMRCLNERIAENGKWLFVDFQVPESGPSRFFARISLRVLYLFFNLACGLNVKKLPSFSAMFEALRLHVEREKSFCSERLTAKVYSRR